MTYKMTQLATLDDLHVGAILVANVDAIDCTLNVDEYENVPTSAYVLEVTELETVVDGSIHLFAGRILELNIEDNGWEHDEIGDIESGFGFEINTGITQSYPFWYVGEKNDD